jgi:nucleoside-diphosphate-sugar epimerase
MKKILLIGGNGYIGSFLSLNLVDKYTIKIVDINWFNDISDTSLDFKNLGDDYIKDFDAVILLAGHSSVKMCDTDMMSSFNNNVNNFINLVSKIGKNQKFIYASSSSVYGHTGNSIVDETYKVFEPNNYYDLSKQVIDMYVTKNDINYYGLRFGTVNGWSPRLRTDIMINAMVNSAKTDGHIKLYIKDIMRPILGIKDLCRAIEAIINCDIDKRGIYNLASFNNTSEGIAKGVSSIMNMPVIEYNVLDLEKITNVKLQTSAYNFAIDSSKFEREFNFKFNESIESITKSLIDGFDNCDKTNRNIIKKYE